MRKWLTLVVTTSAVAVAVAVPSLAEGASHKHKKCSLDLTTVTAPVSDTGTPPLSGVETRGGVTDGTLCGKAFHGAARVVITFMGPSSRALIARTFGPLGSFATGRRPLTTVPHPDGSIAISGTALIFAGTGVYKGATGSLSVNGSKAANSPVQTIHVTGAMTF